MCESRGQARLCLEWSRDGNSDGLGAWAESRRVEVSGRVRWVLLLRTTEVLL